MGKVRGKQPSKHSNHHDSPHRTKKTITRRQHSQNSHKNGRLKSGVQPNIQPKRNSAGAHARQHGRLSIPFTQWDRVLLIGEGDFSFALSLSRHHNISNIVATCYDSNEALKEKYPDATATVATLIRPNNETTPTERTGCEPDVWNGFSPAQSDDDEQKMHDSPLANKERSNTNAVVHFDIDATKLSTIHKKTLRPHAPFTKIVFNFPHVGGLSTDVNRQVRSNQQLLVDFFRSAKPLLATAADPAKSVVTRPEDERDDENYGMQDGGDEEDTASQQAEYLKHGKILVTLFEGEPYTLWNIRDLARHSGLKVVESFKFPWSAYPGYLHARTIGEITTGKDRTDEGKRKGAWRGEERDARCFVLALQDDDDGRPAPGSRKKRAREDDSE